MRLSSGLMYTSHKLMELVLENPMSQRDIESLLSRSWVASPAESLNLSMRCGWIEVNEKSYFSVTLRGREILNEPDYQLRLRYQLEDFIRLYKPSWSRLLPSGRTQTLSILTPDVFQCFKEAELIRKPPSGDVVKWWDKLASHARGQRDALLLEVGREGELLSIQFETERVGVPPKWQSIESNSDGYDLLSQVSTTDERHLSIEVKSSVQSIKDASFYLTRNEWKHAKTAANYEIHLWAQVDTNPQHALLKRDDVIHHIPQNLGNGEWVSSEIPFSAFMHKFIGHHKNTTSG